MMDLAFFKAKQKMLRERAREGERERERRRAEVERAKREGQIFAARSNMSIVVSSNSAQGCDPPVPPECGADLNKVIFGAAE